MRYQPQLDGLRALAVCGVLYTHFVAPDTWAGHFGVRLFFVISGFLITSILLRDGLTLSFYIRRAARLLPILYVSFLFGLILDFHGIRSSWKWHFAQLSNILYFRSASWDPSWVASHLWTLNVEEQFYIVWPLVIHFTPRRCLQSFLAVIASVGPLYRYVTGFDEFWSLLPFAQFDALAMGGLLALAPSTRVYLAGLVAVPTVAAGLALGANQFVEFLSVVPFCALVLAGSRGDLKLLQWSWLVGLGKISYGVYVLHIFVWAAMMKFGWPYGRGVATLLAGSALTIVLAAASYKLFERPIRDYAARRFRRAKQASLATPG